MYVASSAPLPLPTFFARVDYSGRDEQDLAGLERDRRLSSTVILHIAFEDIDDFFARMRVPG